MTRNEQFSDKIRSNSLKLLSMDFNSQEAHELRIVQSELLTKQLRMTIGEKLEIVDVTELDDDGTTHDPVFTPEEIDVDR